MKKSVFVESDYNLLIERLNKISWSKYDEVNELISNIFENSQPSKAKLFSKFCLYLCKESDNILHKLIIIDVDKEFSYKVLGDENDYTFECKDVKKISEELNKKFGFRCQIIRFIQKIVENMNRMPNIIQYFYLLSEIYKSENEDGLKKNRILSNKIIELLLETLNKSDNKNNECLYILLNGLYPSIINENSLKPLISEIISKIENELKENKIETCHKEIVLDLISKYNKPL